MPCIVHVQIIKEQSNHSKKNLYLDKKNPICIFMFQNTAFKGPEPNVIAWGQSWGLKMPAQVSAPLWLWELDCSSGHEALLPCTAEGTV